MTQFEKTQTYQDILNRGESNSITIPFHIETELFVTDENFEDIVQAEIKEYEDKAFKIKQIIPDFPVNPNINNVIRERITPFIGKKYLRIEYANLTSENLLNAVRELEIRPEFKGWLVR